MLLTPEYLFSGVAAITPEFLAQRGITALALDVDNTLTAHGSQRLPPAVAEWLGRMRGARVSLAIVSNNGPERVRPFAEGLGLPFVANACKPLGHGLRQVQRQFGVPKSGMALVGDQLFTDRLAGAMYGVTVLVVQPMAPEIKAGIKLKRVLEKPFLRRYFKRGGKVL